MAARVGVHFGFGGADDPAVLKRIVEKVEELGFHGLFVSEALGEQPLDPFGLLSLASTYSDRIALGVVDYSLALRHPLVTARSVSSLQRLSDGRVILGVESSSLGALEAECLELVRKAWREETLSFSGRFFRVEGVKVSSQLPENMDPHVWIEGKSGASVAAAVRYGSGLVPKNVSQEEFWALAEQVRLELRRGQRAAGFVLGVRLPLVLAQTQRRAELLAAHYAKRCGEDVELFLSHSLVGDPSAVTERVASYFEAGARYVVLSTAHLGGEGEQLEALAAFSRDVAPSL